MTKLTGFSVITTGEGKRVTCSYSKLDEQGNVTSQNNRANYIALEEETLAAVAVLEADALAHIDAE